MALAKDRKIKLPVRCIDGRWELEFGGEVPVVDGSRAELSIEESAFSDPEFIASFRKKTHIPILPKGTTLLACLNIKDKPPLAPDARSALMDVVDINGELAPGLLRNWSSSPFSFVEVSIGAASTKQSKLPELQDGGLWLTVEGNVAKGLITSRIQMPDFMKDEFCISLNHAFTRLSEVYEPWRLAHTGSVYERYLYKESDGKWYPLELLRDAAEAEEEQKIAHDLWQRFLSRMKPGNN